MLYEYISFLLYNSTAVHPPWRHDWDLYAVVCINFFVGFIRFREVVVTTRASNYLLVALNSLVGDKNSERNIQEPLQGTLSLITCL